MRREDKLGSVTQDTPRADIDLILKKYLELINLSVFFRRQTVEGSQFLELILRGDAGE